MPYSTSVATCAATISGRDLTACEVSFGPSKFHCETRVKPSEPGE
jgi:hypothetical protein